jgi:hypothetical protein
MATNGEKKRVLILGAGAAGISAALELKKTSAHAAGLEVTLVGQQDDHCPLPFVWQVVSGSVQPGHISFPVRVLLKEWGAAGPVKFRQSQVRSIDVERKVVSTDGGELEWDYLVVALGSTTNFFGMADAEENSLTLKSVGDAISIHNRILDNYETALRDRTGGGYPGLRAQGIDTEVPFSDALCQSTPGRGTGRSLIWHEGRNVGTGYQPATLSKNRGFIENSYYQGSVRWHPDCGWTDYTDSHCYLGGRGETGGCCGIAALQ